MCNCAVSLSQVRQLELSNATPMNQVQYVLPHVEAMLCTMKNRKATKRKAKVV